MSRAYSMNVAIGEIAKQELSAVKNALEEETRMEWEYDTWSTKEYVKVSCQGDGNLCGGEQEEHFAKRVVVAIWKANGGFCKVDVSLTPLDNSEVYPFDEADYKKIMEA